MGYLRAIERLTKKEMKGMKPPTREEAYQASLAVAFDEIKRDLTDEKISAKLNKFDEDADKLLAEYDAKLLVSLLLQAKVSDPDTRPKVDIAPEKPLPFNGEGGKGGGGGRGGNRGGGGSRGRNDRRGGGGGFNRDKRSGGGRDRDDRNKKDYYKKDKQKVHPHATEKKPGFVIRNKGDK